MSVSHVMVCAWLLETSTSKHHGRRVQVTCWERKWHVIWCWFLFVLFPCFQCSSFSFCQAEKVPLPHPPPQDFAGVGRVSFIWTNKLACCWVSVGILTLSCFYPRCNKDAYTRSYSIHHTLNSLLIYKVNETVLRINGFWRWFISWRITGFLDFGPGIEVGLRLETDPFSETCVFWYL